MLSYKKDNFVSCRLHQSHSMKKTFLSFIILGFSFLALLSSCSPDEEIRTEGCTDPVSTNYDPDADIDDGSCTYISKEQTIWANGTHGNWNDEVFIGTIVIKNCNLKGSVDTAAIDGRTALLLTKDPVQGFFGMHAQIANVRDAPEFKTGYLKFEAMLPSTSDVAVFDVFIHGTNCDNLNCSGTCRSAYVSVETSSFIPGAFNEVVIPLVDFEPASFVSMTNVFGVYGRSPGGTNDSVLFIDNVRWDTDLTR